MDNILESKIGCDKIAYADDCLLTVTANSLHDLHAKSDQIAQKVYQICSNIKRKQKADKTVYMIIKKKKIPTDYNIMINNTMLKRQEHVKYLGVTVGSNLKFDEHIKRITTAALHKLVSFYDLSNTVWGYSGKMLQFLYHSTVEPAVTYASSVSFKTVKNKTNC